MNWLDIFTPQSILPIAALAGAIWLSIRSGGFKGSKDSNEILRGQIMDYKEELKLKDEKHAREIVQQRDLYEQKVTTLQAQIDTLNTQVLTLKQANDVYQNTVTGKETLAQIIKILTPIPAIIAPGGLLDTFKTNDEIIIKAQKEIKDEILRNITELKGIMGDKRNQKKLAMIKQSETISK